MTNFSFADLLNAAGGTLTPIPKGVYNMTVASAEYTTSGTGKPMYKIKLSVDEGPHMGRHVYTQFVISAENPNALRMFFKNMKALGFTEEYFKAGPDPASVAGLMFGRRVSVTVDHRVWAGENRENVTAIQSNTVPGVPGMSPPPIAPPTGPPPVAPPPPPAPPAPPVAQVGDAAAAHVQAQYNVPTPAAMPTPPPPPPAPAPQQPAPAPQPQPPAPPAAPPVPPPPPAPAQPAYVQPTPQPEAPAPAQAPAAAPVYAAPEQPAAPATPPLANIPPPPPVPF